MVSIVLFRQQKFQINVIFCPGCELMALDSVLKRVDRNIRGQERKVARLRFDCDGSNG